jgi:5'-deoxynucleotidase YfbR-like HD superfamily hydrolase
MNTQTTTHEHICAQYPHEVVLELIRQLESVYGLRKIRRWGIEDHHFVVIESVPEHTFNTSILADFFYQMEAFPSPLRIDRVHTLIRYHDSPEVKGNGDVVQTRKSDSDELCDDDHLIELRRELPDPLAACVIDAIREFDAQETLEAKAAWACEKFEPGVEILLHGVDRLVGPESGCIPDDAHAWHGWTPNARRKATRPFPIVNHFGEVIHEEIMCQLEEHRPDWAAE